MKKIKLTKGLETLVDDEDFDKLNAFTWHCVGSGKRIKYAGRRPSLSLDKKRKYIFIHREVMNCPDNMVVDHIDGNGLNNQKENLRICTLQENLMNQRKSTKKNPKIMTRYKGVYILRGKKRDSFMALIAARGEKYYLGCFKADYEAAFAYNTKAYELHKEFARLNTIKSNLNKTT